MGFNYIISCLSWPGHWDSFSLNRGSSPLDISASPRLLASPKLPAGTWTHLASTIKSMLQNAKQDVHLPGSLKNKISHPTIPFSHCN